MRGGLHKHMCAKTVNLKLAVPSLLLLKFKRGLMTMMNTKLLFNVNCNVFSAGGVPVLYRFMSRGRQTATCKMVGVVNMSTKTFVARLLKQ